MKIRALVVDDEPLARRSLCRLLDKSPGVDVIGEYGDGESAVEAIGREKPDLVFLDVQMPEMSGFDVIQKIGAEAMPVTIFVTAYDRYALEAFDANAIDYLLKPFRHERFERALARAKERIAGKLNVNELRLALASLEPNGKRKCLERLPVIQNGRILLVSVSEIDWIGAEGNYAELHSAERKYEIRETLTHLAEKLDPAQFVRIHRSTIVNVHRIKEIQPWFRGHHLVILHSGAQLRMSRYKRDVAKQLGLL